MHTAGLPLTPSGFAGLLLHHNESLVGTVTCDRCGRASHREEKRWNCFDLQERRTRRERPRSGDSVGADQLGVDWEIYVRPSSTSRIAGTRSVVSCALFT